MSDALSVLEDHRPFIEWDIEHGMQSNVFIIMRSMGEKVVRLYIVLETMKDSIQRKAVVKVTDLKKLTREISFIIRQLYQLTHIKRTPCPVCGIDKHYEL